MTRKRFYYFTLLATTVIILIYLFLPTVANVAYSLATILLGILAFAANHISKEEKKRIDNIDIGILLIFIYEIINYTQSLYWYNSLSSLTTIVMATIIHYYCRNYGAFYKKQKKLIFEILTIAAGLLVICSLIGFWLYRIKMSNLGFENLHHFRNYFRPFNQLSNDWNSCLLFFMPIILIGIVVTQNKVRQVIYVLCSGIVTLGILVSYSRGAYLSLFVFIGTLTSVLVVSNIKIPKIIWINGIVIVIIIMTMFITNVPTRQTVNIAAGQSNVRSNEGRIAMWNMAKEVIKDTPLFGIGTGNTIVKYEKKYEKKEDSLFTNRITNSSLQLLSEKGFIGAVIWITVIIIILITYLKTGIKSQLPKQEKIIALIMFAGVIAILVKEQTFSSYFYNSKIALLIALMVSSTLPTKAQTDKKSGLWLDSRIPFVMIILISLWLISIPQQKLNNGMRYNNEYIKSSMANMPEMAYLSIQKAIKNVPDMGLLYAHQCYALSKMGSSKADAAIKSMEKSITLNPYDSHFQCNIGLLYGMHGDTLTARIHLRKAIELDQYNPLYHVAYSQLCKESSLMHLEQAIRLSPDFLESFLWKKVQQEIQIDTIEKLYTRLRKKAGNQIGNPIIDGRQAKILLHLGDTSNAEKMLKRVVEQLPYLNRPWLYLGEIKLKHGDSLAFIKYTERAMFLDKQDYLPPYCLGQYYEKQYNTNRAKVYYIMALVNYQDIYTPHFIRSGSYYGGFGTLPDDIIIDKFLETIRPNLPVRMILGKLMNQYQKEQSIEAQEACSKYLKEEQGLRETLNKLICK